MPRTAIPDMVADLHIIEAMAADPALRRDFDDARARLTKLADKLRASEEKRRPPPAPAELGPAARPLGMIVYARKPQLRR